LLNTDLLLYSLAGKEFLLKIIYGILSRQRSGFTLLVSCAFNFNIRPQWQLMHSNASPDRLRIGLEELSVDIVQGSKIFHISEENVDFDTVVDGASSCV